MMSNIDMLKEKFKKYTDVIYDAFDDNKKSIYKKVEDRLSVYGGSKLLHYDTILMIAIDLLHKKSDVLSDYTPDEISVLAMANFSGSIQDYNIDNDYTKKCEMFDKEVLDQIISKQKDVLARSVLVSDLNHCIEEENWTKEELKNYVRNSSLKDFTTLSQQINEKISNRNYGV